MTEADTLVTRWSYHDYETPIPLVRRSSIEVGDIVDSSHHGKVKVIEVHRTEGQPHNDVGFVFSRPDGTLPSYGTWVERHPGYSLVPRFEKAKP